MHMGFPAGILVHVGFPAGTIAGSELQRGKNENLVQTRPGSDSGHCCHAAIATYGKQGNLGKGFQATISLIPGAQ